MASPESERIVIVPGRSKSAITKIAGVIMLKAVDNLENKILGDIHNPEVNQISQGPAIWLPCMRHLRREVQGHHL
jgi:hypothetical protein